MRDKLNQFIDNLNGQFVEISYKEAIYQCMDLVYSWVFCLGFPKSAIQHQYAYQVYTEATDFTRQLFDVIENKLETIPQTGDLVVWNKTATNIAGHIAIVIEATQSRMKAFEQNSPLGTNAHISDRTYTNVLGFLRPKNVIIDGVPQWLTTLLQERGLEIKNESEIRLIFEKAKKYDDEIKTLQEQVKMANEQLADKSLEVSRLTGKEESLTAKLDELQKLYTDVRNERDTLSGEKQRLVIKNEEIEKQLIDALNENIKLTSEVELLKKEAVSALTKWDLLKLTISLFIGGDSHG